MGALTLVTAIHIYPECGPIGLNGIGWAARETALTGDTVISDGVSHGMGLAVRVRTERVKERGGLEEKILINLPLFRISSASISLKRVRHKTVVQQFQSRHRLQ